MFRLRCPLIHTLAALLAVGVFAPVQADDAGITQALFEYVHEVDDESGPAYAQRFSTQANGIDIDLYTVRSQTWQGHDLFNQMYTAVPVGMDPSEAKHVLLVITGGSFRSRLFEPPSERELRRFVKKARRYAPLIKKLNTPAVVVRHVPFQRMKLCPGDHKRGLSEDALIACSLQKYLETEDPNWPLLFPMTKTVKVNMDVAEKIFQEEWGAEIESCNAIGASKRGWTSHLISIVDERVTASIPIVINMLNMPEYIKHAERVWGEHSPQIRDYAERGILAQFDTPVGARMLAMIDPYTYREHLNKPKLMIFGTNDPYWPVDSTRHYAAQLPGETRLLFLPNQGHSATLGGVRLLTAASRAQHQSAARGRDLATLDWFYESSAEELRIRLDTDVAPSKVEVWSATSTDRDFRDERWRKRVVCGAKGALPWSWWRRDCSELTATTVKVPEDACRAQFVQVYFEHDGFARYPNSTDVAVTGPDRCVGTPTYTAER